MQCFCYALAIMSCDVKRNTTFGSKRVILVPEKALSENFQLIFSSSLELVFIAMILIRLFSSIMIRTKYFQTNAGAICVTT